MRKLKLQVQVTVDGYVGGPQGEMDWPLREWDDDLKKYVGALTDGVDCILLGRKLAQGFIPYWAANPQQEGAAVFNGTHKVVFSKTLERSEWANTELARGDLAEEVMRLKQQPGGDLIAYGGAGFVSALVQNNLIDEYHLFVNPVAIGSGLGIFSQVQGRLGLKLLRAVPFTCGMVVMVYQPAE